MKYKNKDGISLNYTNNDVHSHLVREVISETIHMLKKSRHGDTIPETIEFLKENFNIN